VVSFYGWDTGSGTKIKNELFETAKVVTCLSEDMRDDLVNMGCPRDKTRKVPLCIDTRNFRYKERDPEPEETVRILTVARFAEKKGLKYAVRAIADLDTEREIRYSIAGDGERRDQIEELIEEVGAEDRIDLLGWQSQERISELMNESHLFLLPSVTTESGGKEGTPTVLLEAQYSGLPVVSTYHAGIPEIVKDGKSGILVPERDVESLTEALNNLIEIPNQWGEMGRSGRKYVEENHSIESVTDDLLDIYRGVK
jgi:colanic acid/amylovoran biosynthesis glycosyltransferase